MQGEDKSEEEKKELQKKLQEYEDNLIYIKFFPSNAKYLSLYAAESGTTKEKRDEVLAKIKEKLKTKEEKFRADVAEENVDDSDKEKHEENKEDDFFLSESTAIVQ